MRLIRISSIIAITLVFAGGAFAQKPLCALKQAPEFRGFYLGMTSLEVRSKLEDTTLFDHNAPSGRPGSQAVRITAAELKEDIAEGIDEINLAFVDGKLALIKVTYNNVVMWDNAQDFLTKTSETLGLPKFVPTKMTGERGNEKYKFECLGFAVSLAYAFGVSPNFTINDMTAQKLADQRLSEQGDVKTITISPQTTRKP